jgi:hypothetical protein
VSSESDDPILSHVAQNRIIGSVQEVSSSTTYVFQVRRGKEWVDMISYDNYGSTFDLGLRSSMYVRLVRRTVKEVEIHHEHQES